MCAAIQAAARCLRLFGAAAEGFPEFAFDKRTCRQPADPVKPCRRSGYALLVRTWLTVLSVVGFDPYLGFYHKPRFGRSGPALDMREPFRSIHADSTSLPRPDRSGRHELAKSIAAGLSAVSVPQPHRNIAMAFDGPAIHRE